MADHTPLPRFITGLLDERAYPHPTDSIRLLETHISWVLLTGQLAYKVKKPVDFGFLDFSTLAKRQQACTEELRLNRRLAAPLYQAVVTIGGTPEHPLVGADPALDYAVRMRQFDPDQGFDQLISSGALEPLQLDRLAAIVAAFHRDLPAAGAEAPYGEPTAVLAPMRANFAHIRPALRVEQEQAALDALQGWTDASAERLYASLVERKRDGWVRECHGDLHLGNIVLDNDRPLVFDCIEFNPGLRWIDTVSELAFTTMDLDHSGHPRLAWRYLNQYLEHSGDYPGLGLLRFYQVYRALVRAKVEALRAHQEAASAADAAYPRIRSHLQLATAYSARQLPALLITHGLSGSGKTTISDRLIEHLGAIRVRSDVERKRLFGLARDDSSPPSGRRRIYGHEANAATYQRLLDYARSLLGSGFTVIIEATFLSAASRTVFRELATELQLPFLILDLQAQADTLIKRVTRRAEQGRDASEADAAVLRRQLDTRQPLHDGETPHALVVDTEAPIAYPRLTERIRSALSDQRC